MLKLRNLTQSFPGSYAPILNAIDLELLQGDFCVVIGSNGSGKSTLMRAILGETITDTGNFYIDGEDFSNKDRSHFIASVVQDVNRGTVPEMTLLENMALSAIRGKRAKLTKYSQYEKDAMRQIATLNAGLESFINTPLYRLSGGQRQMLATLMAVNSKPQILLLDEHTSALDPKMQQQLMEYTATAVAQNNITTLMVTHKLDDAIRYGNRLIMLHQGKIIYDVAGLEKAALRKSDVLALFSPYETLRFTALDEIS